MSDAGRARLEPLRRFLVERGWPQRISTYDRYGGVGMSVELVPAPSAEQHEELRAVFGDSYAFTQITASLQQDPSR